MKVFIVLAACMVSVASAGHLGGYGGSAHQVAAIGGGGYGHAGGVVSTGQSTQYREEDSYGNYRFGYDESHASGGSGRREERHGDVVTGSYNLAVHDGRSRRVDYISDKHGFRATVHTNEEGVDASRDPAAVLINKQGVPAVPVEQIVAAPVASYAPIAAPVHHQHQMVSVHQHQHQQIAPLAHSAGYGAAQLALPAPVYQSTVARHHVVAQAAPIYEAAPVVEAAPRQFSYSFGTEHASPVGYAAQAPLALAAPVAHHHQVGYSSAPLVQHGLKY